MLDEVRVAESGFHEKVFGLDGQGHCDIQAIGWVCFGEVEGLEKCCGGEDSFLPGEGSADAGSRAIALEERAVRSCVIICVGKQCCSKGTYEWFPSIGRQGVECFFIHALRAERLSVWTVHLQVEEKTSATAAINILRTVFI